MIIDSLRDLHKTTCLWKNWSQAFGLSMRAKAKAVQEVIGLVEVANKGFSGTTSLLGYSR
jgi:hypothetical protein